MNEEKQIPIDLSKTQPIKCSQKTMLHACGSEEFTQITYLRRLPLLLSPSGREEIIPIPAYKCVKCGTILNFDQK